MKEGVHKRSQEISSKLKTRDFSALLGGLPDGGAGEEVAADRFGFENAEYILVDPAMIALEGDYVRTPEEVEADPDFEAFAEAIQEAGRIEQPAGVRTIGEGWEKRYVLVWGMRRWRAALRAGIKLPVVDKGALTEDEAYALQMRENENRSNPRPVQIALGYHRWVQRGRSQNQVAREAGRDKGYVSYMRATGEALATMTPEERRRLAASPLATVRRFQEIAKLEGVQERANALRSLIQPAEPKPSREARSGAMKVSAESTRTGRRLRLEWKEQELKRNPLAVVEALQKAFRDEQRQVLERLQTLAEQAESRRGGRAEARQLRAAVEQAQGVFGQVAGEEA